MVFIFGILAIFTFLFCLYRLGKDDFIFLRKNISMEQLFNMAFFFIVVSLLTARVFYVLIHFSWQFLNPFVFFLIPYFPGLSFIGGMIGGLLFLLYYSEKMKLPKKRILDFFSLSLVFTLPVGLIGFLFDTNLRAAAVVGIGCFVFAAVVFLQLYKRLISGGLKEGTLTSVYLLTFTFIIVLMTFTYRYLTQSLVFQRDDILLFVFGIGAFLVCFKTIYGDKRSR
ncbi:MAG TPA: prolipoprotein diacylglyceryl transferase family protein [Patescibacteria group bacterium]|nr:prolipoprotein diacylglyceryl transferase family protein [Patescibacteria group bacterium]